MSDDFALKLVCPVGGRASHDHYPTPPSAVAPLVRLAQAERWWAPGEAVLDPCCGEGELLDVLRDLAGLKGRGIELAPTRAELARRRGHPVEQGDAFALPWGGASIVVSNPPFSLGQEFAEAALERRPARGIVCMLLATNFVETPGRARLHKAHRGDLFPLSRRPRFPNANTGPLAWFVWGASPGGRWSVLGE